MSEILTQIRIDTGICHLRVDAAQSLTDFLLRVNLAPLEIEPTPALIAEWLHYGSLYVDGLRARADRAVLPDQIIRLHTRRKTYVTQIPTLKERVIFDHSDFLVLDKPSGLPTHATLDNFIENAAFLAAAELQIPIFVTHRLDVATAGLLILAKSPKAQAALNKQFAKRQVQKFYRAKTAHPVSPGPLTHFMDPASRVPKHVGLEPVPGWWECRLIVEACEPIAGHEDRYQTRLQLLTGKTHQIRAQLAAVGSPVNGDRVYGSTVEASDGQIDLECWSMKLRWLQMDYEFKRR